MRELFVTDRNNPILEDKYLLLSPLFAMMHQIVGEEKNKYAIPTAKKLLEFTNDTIYTRPVPDPIVVTTFDQFNLNWQTFSGGILEGLNFDNVFIAGGR